MAIEDPTTKTTDDSVVRPVRICLLRIGGERTFYDGDVRLMQVPAVRMAGITYVHSSNASFPGMGWCRVYHEIKVLVLSNGVPGRRARHTG